MAPTVGKFCLPSWRMLAVSCAVFILLSDVLATSEQRQCFWCGPLAEQIHRSRRAPACDVPGENATTCDPGFTHCAIVATSPPYVESRYCVKFYQDECYSLYCSSTKTWRMTCPCRGDFCNGDKTERESEAFARLAKLVANTQNNRIKKRTVITPNSVDTSDKMQAAATLAKQENITNEADNGTYSEEINNYSQTDEQNVSNENIPTKSDNLHVNSDINISYSKTDELNIIENDVDELITSKEGKIQIINVRTPAIQATESSVITELITSEKTGSNSVKPSEQSATEIHQEFMDKDGMLRDTTKTHSPTETNSKLINNNLIKPSEILPTAEALQQNGSPPAITETPIIIPEEATVITTHVEITAISTIKIDESVSTESTKEKENGAERNILKLYIISNCMFLYLVV